MKKKYYNKKHADNYFTAETGIKAYKVQNKTECFIVDQETMKFEGKRHRTVFVAASLVADLPLSEIKSVDQCCGIKNCIKPECFIIEKVEEESIDDVVFNGWG